MKFSKRQAMGAGVAVLLLIAIAAALGLHNTQNGGSVVPVTPVPAENTGDSLIPTRSAQPKETAAPQEPALPSASAAVIRTQPPAPAMKTASPQKTVSPQGIASANPVARPVNTNPPSGAENKVERLCTVIVQCDILLSNMDKLKKEKRELVPADGILLKSENVEFFEEETVFNVLQRELKKNKVHFDFSSNGAFDTAYIKGIGNLYERDCGELSGWMYKVNGTFIQAGCSQYKLSPGDVVEWVYSCDAGRDLGVKTEAD